MKLKTTSFWLIILITGNFLLSTAVLFAQDNQVISLKKQSQPQANKHTSKEKLALSYYRNKEYQKAAELYNQLYNEKPLQQYYTFLFNSLVALKEYKPAEKLVKKQIKKHPKTVRYVVDHAYVLKLSDNEKKADKILEDLIEDLPNNRALVIQLSTALQSKGFYEQALVTLQKAKEMPGNEYPYAIEMANVFQYTGDYDKMFDAYLDYLNQSPQEMQRVRNRLQSYLRLDINDDLSSILKTKLYERAQSDPENLAYAEMLLWYALQIKNFKMAFLQARAIDKRFGNRIKDMLEVAEISMANHEYEVAAESYAYIKDKKEATPFYLESYSGYFNAMVKAAEENAGTDIETYKSLEIIGKAALSETGLNRQTVAIAANLAHIIAFKLGDFQQAIELLEQGLAINQLLPDKIAGLKLELADILLYEGQEWDASLYYSQIEADMKNEPIGHDAKFRNAKLFYFMGEYLWAQTKLDILRSATSKLIANDAMELSIFISDILEEDTLGLKLRSFGKADMLIYQGQNEAALNQLKKIEEESFGPNSIQYVYYKKAQLLVVMKQFVLADSMYAKLSTNFPESIKTDNAIYQRAEIQRLYLNNELKAMDLYLQLMTDYPESIYAGQARTKYRMLREDEIIPEG